ncbi:ComF family protein [Geoalkalibacter sp.]|uniref:ComF family protein n=1 Tax=Geoalkalibacter sp. TaxID=3041440 RepID=UPI00272EE2F4|nr:ComF family protein [Geoalkalibacter sp.]
MSLPRFLPPFFGSLLRLLLPPCCPFCEALLEDQAGFSSGFCAVCRESFRSPASPCCPRCCLPYPTQGGTDHLCEPCQRREPPFCWVAAAALYEGELREAVHRFKFGGRLDLDRPLGRLMLERLGERLRAFAPQAVVAVPLHPRRLRERGYNQALLLARVLGKELGVAVPSAGLVRSRETQSQQRLSRDERWRNLQGIFVAGAGIAGRRILLVDDVVTTGATAAECARSLLAAGAASVAVAALARAPRHGRPVIQA